MQLNAPDDRFYLRAFVQNLTNNNAITGQAVADQSSGLYTNIFTIEPRRYGAAVGLQVRSLGGAKAQPFAPPSA